MQASEETPPKMPNSQSGLAVVRLIKVPTYRFLCLCFPAYTSLLWLLYTWLPNFLYEKFSLTLTEAGFTATVYLQSATFLGLLVGGALADWLYPRTKAARFWLVCSGMLFSAPWVYLIGNSDSLFTVKVAALGFGFGSGLFMSNLMVSALEVVPADAGASAVGLINFIGALASGLAALFGGVLKKSIGIHAVMTCAAFLSVLAGAILVLGVRIYFEEDYERVH